MKPLLTLICLGFQLAAMAQYSMVSLPEQSQQNDQTNTKHRTKAVMYNTLGYAVQLNQPDLVVGGTSLVYKKFGTFLSYKVGIRNWLLPENGEKGDVTYQNVLDNSKSSSKWAFTGNEQRATTFMISGGLCIPITRRIPIYFGAGGSRFRTFFEYNSPFDSTAKWNVNPEKTGFEINYTAGIMIPLGRFLVNIGYDHNPQSIFIAIGISGKYVYEDVDEWWWGSKKRATE